MMRNERAKWQSGRVAFVVAAACLLWVGCSTEDKSSTDKGCAVGKCDNVDPSELACADINDKSGRDLAFGFLAGRKDPIAEKVLKPGGTCPTTFEETMAKLRENDVEGCERGSCPTCEDGRENGDETDSDCGGGVCRACEDGKGCGVGADCTSGSCGDDGKCAANACDDGVKNGDETDTDCGGACGQCANSATCSAGGDCESGNCESGTCVADECSNSSKDGDETDTDCGGLGCAGCDTGGACAAATDCASGVCTDSACVAATCEDGAHNGDEMGTDCGGSCATKCAARELCDSGDDCESGSCDSGRCLATAKECAPNLRTGINTMAVSESAQIQDAATNYRLAVTRKCDGRDQFALFFSLFGVSPTGALPDDVEVISFDSETKLFNYYALEGGEWTFFGDSTDMIKDGATTRCAGCHTGGGLVMKELDTPWMHWEGHTDTPGAKELVDAHEDLGSKSSGSRMESLVNSGNRAWNPVRVQFFKSQGDVKGALKPLFCTVEVNIDNGSDFPDTKMSSVKADFLLDPTFKSFGSISVSNDDYVAALESQDHTMQGLSGKRDTLFDFAFPERSKADIDYVKKLKDVDVVDDDFIRDALIVDFTRPIWSDDRCGLLSFAPELDAADMTSANVKAGFITNLEAASPAADSAAGRFLANLQNTDDKAAHDTTISTFWDACGARDKKQFIEDAVAVAGLLRDRARQLGVFEFPLTMPFSAGGILDAGTTFDPVTCELSN